MNLFVFPFVKDLQDSYRDVKYIISKTSLDTIQVVFLDQNAGDIASKLGATFKADLEAGNAFLDISINNNNHVTRG